MSLNLINLKKRDSNPVWLNLVDKDGKPLLYDVIALEQKQAFEDKVARFKAGKLKKEPKLDCEQKPVRIKMESPHSEAFRKAKMHRKVKDQITAQGVIKAAEQLALETGEFDANKMIDNSIEKICEGIENGAKMIAELTIEWEGFRDPETLEPVEYSPKLLAGILSDPDNMATYTHIVKAVDTGEGFFTE